MSSPLLPHAAISLSGEAADQLLNLGDGDAALLYLAILRHQNLPGARTALKWSLSRLDSAYAVLVDRGLARPAVGQAETGAPPEPDTPPDYMLGDITKAIEGDPTFAALEKEAERLFGKLLSTADLKQLYLIYDYLALPPDVILLLLHHCLRETQRRYGPGRKPKMNTVKKTAFRWSRLGLDSPEAVEEFLKAQTALQGREADILPIVGVVDRRPLEKEREYITTWVDWGFSDEAIRMAYERTLMKKQNMSWSYMNSILRSWHSKGLHTPADIKAGDRTRPVRPPKGAAGQEVDAQLARELDDLFGQ